MEKLIIVGIALLIGYISSGNYTPGNPPVKIYPKKDNSDKLPDKPQMVKFTYVIKDYDPH